METLRALLGRTRSILHHVVTGAGDAGDDESGTLSGAGRQGRFYLRIIDTLNKSQYKLLPHI